MDHHPNRMYVDDGDWAPSTLLQTSRMTGGEVAGGIAGISFPVGLLGVWIVLNILGGALLAATADDGPTINPDDVVAARFVRAGREFLEQLPNRNVPVKSTAPDNRTHVSKAPQDVIPPDAGPRPIDPMNDDLTRLLDRADLFAEIAEQQEMEGHPDGIEEGTETEAQAGDIYRGQLYTFFKRGWAVPTTINDEERRGLSVEATITVNDHLHLISFRLRGTSGNADFDQSVVSQLEGIRERNDEMPDPPVLERATWLNQPFTLRFRGRDARTASQ